MIGINKFSAECASIDQVSGLLSTSGWDAEFQQLDRGCAPARIRVVGSPRTTLMQIDLANKVYQQGMPGHGTYTFGLPTAPQASGRLGRRILESESLTCFDPVAGMDVVSEAGFSAYTMAFSADRLAELANLLELPEPQYLFKGSNSQRYPSVQELRALRQFLTSALQLVVPGPVTSSHAAVADLETELPLLLLRAWSEARPAGYVPSSYRSRALRQALDLIRSRPPAVLTVEQLCRETACSIATLERAFRDHFGLSPKRFIMATRLAGVRRTLLAGDDSRSIADVASHWGFWHMSKFAGDYRAVFGELPSETRNITSQ